ncbi:plasmid partitioning protein RepB [uncultured Pelagimonas sp.]|uniref:plasmid partitioning protein RepB n=1 Tax=uncultured Pelagimonas sp. TaxID=1618102 RepID=UPI002618215A|nr:plasmid partitioning protein RepB [uncultured Pelagimonas sp.]
MARKNLLQGLMEEAAKNEAAPPSPAPSKAGVGKSTPPKSAKTSKETDQFDPARPRRSTGAIGAVSQSIAQLKSRSVIEIDPFDIKDGGLQDRLDHQEDEHQALMESMREYGQQVPVLVRPHPEEGNSYQIVYGRRRVLALRDLGIPVKALVRDLDDDALVMAQGQENSARRDLTFIEKCNFAYQMREGGYKRKVICDALSIDKTLISRMFSIVDRVGLDVIQVVGSAPGVGRDRWAVLADQMEEIFIDPKQVASAVVTLAGDRPSPERFEAALKACGVGLGSEVKKPPAPRGKTTHITSANGFEIAKALHKESEVVLTLPRTGDDKFGDWLVDQLHDIYQGWVSQSAEDKAE